MKVFLAATMLLFSLNAFADADGPDCWDVKGVASNDTLNVREQPSAKAKVLGTIPPNAKALANLTEEPEGDMNPPKHPGWCKIKYKTLTGWVSCKFLEEGDACE